MKKVNLVCSQGGGNPYSTPELTVLSVLAEQGFTVSPNKISDMTVEEEEDW